MQGYEYEDGAKTGLMFILVSYHMNNFKFDFTGQD